MPTGVNQDLFKWQGVFFQTGQHKSAGTDKPIVFGLVFPDPETGAKAISHMKTWGNVSLDIEEKRNHDVSFFIYDKTSKPNGNKGVLTYSLPQRIKKEEFGINDFLKNHAQDRPILITYFVRVPHESDDRKERFATGKFWETDDYIVINGFAHIQE